MKKFEPFHGHPEEDNRQSKKNIGFLKEGLVKLEENSREALASVTKNTGNKIIETYDRLAAGINEQRCENLRLQMEIANLTKEKNKLRHEIQLLITSVMRIETLLGVDEDKKFKNLINSTFKV